MARLTVKDVKAIRVEALVVAFGWALLADKTSAELSREIVEILGSEAPLDLKEVGIRQLVLQDHNHCRAMPTGNQRRYLQTRVNYQQFRDDLESVILVHSMA